MKIRYYIDLWPGTDLRTYTPMPSPAPGAKGENTVRLSFDIEIPEHLIYQPDGAVPEVSKLREAE